MVSPEEPLQEFLRSRAAKETRQLIFRVVECLEREKPKHHQNYYTCFEKKQQKTVENIVMEFVG
jgi:hypothetical protein